jgi:hypothetical protein
LSTYTDFAEKMIIALYQESERTEKSYHKFGELIDRYNIDSKESWIQRLADEWEYGYASEISRVLGGSARDWDVRISAYGMRYVEEKYGDKGGVGIVLKPVETTARPDPLPEGSSDPREDDVILRDEASATLVPASDRLVSLDHNSAPYLQVKEGLAELYEELRAANDLDCTPEERGRLLSSVFAAQKLWDAAQLKIIQIKVGILITIQDAVDLLGKAGKAVGKSVLIDVVKAIVKHNTGIDL